jgi:hypothetical protein
MANYGGAFVINVNSNYSNSPNCIFKNNSAKYNGGALIIADFSTY